MSGVLPFFRIILKWITYSKFYQVLMESETCFNLNIKTISNRLHLHLLKLFRHLPVQFNNKNHVTQNSYEISHTILISNSRLQKHAFFRRLIDLEFYVLLIIEESVCYMSIKVYIFWMGGSRAFQRRVNHVHTTLTDYSVMLQSIQVI